MTEHENLPDTARTAALEIRCVLERGGDFMSLVRLQATLDLASKIVGYFKANPDAWGTTDGDTALDLLKRSFAEETDLLVKVRLRERAPGESTALVATALTAQVPGGVEVAVEMLKTMREQGYCDHYLDVVSAFRLLEHSADTLQVEVLT